MCYYLTFQKRRRSSKLKSWFRLLLSLHTQALGSHWGGLAGLVDIGSGRPNLLYCDPHLKNPPTDGLVQLSRPAPAGLVQGGGDCPPLQTCLFCLG